MTSTTLGILIGLALGAVLVFGNFGEMLIVALFAIIGFIAAKIIDGDIDASRYLSGRRSNR